MAGGPWEDFQPKKQDSAEADGPWSDFKKAEPKTGAGEAALEHFGNSATLGYLPHVQAFTAPAMNWALDKITGNHVSDDDNSTYVQRRDENIARLEQEDKEHPYASGAGKVAGFAASVLGTGGMGAVAKGAGVATRLSAAAKAGGALGALANPGDVKGEFDPLQVGDRAQNAAVGYALGAGGQLIGEGVGAAGSKVANYFKSKAEQRAFKALGPDLRAVRQNMSKDRLNSIGRTLIDEGIISPRTSVDDIAAAIAKSKSGAVEDLEQVIKDLGQAQQKLNGAGEPGLVPYGTKVGGTRSGIDRKAIAQSLRDDLINPRTEIPGVAAKNKQVEALIRQFEQGGDDLMGLTDAEMLKRATGKEIKWDRLPGADIPIEEQVQRALYGKVRQGVEDGAAAIEGMVGGPGAGRFQAAKQRVGNLEEAGKISEKARAKVLANRFISPSDYMMGAGGAAAGFASGDNMEDKLVGAAVGAGAGALNKFGRTYGNQIAAKSLDAVAKALAKTPQFSELAAKNPAGFAAVVQRAAAKLTGGSAIRPQLAQDGERGVATDATPTKGEAAWRAKGAANLGLDQAAVEKLMQTEQGKRLIYQASGRAPGSPALEAIKQQIRQKAGK